MPTVVPIIKKILEYRTSGTLLDIGAGIGHHALFLAENGFRVTAIDNNEESLNKLREAAKEKNVSIDVRLGNVQSVGSLNKKWDIVVCTFVLHFLQDNEIDRAIKNLKSITADKGLNVIAVHTTENFTERERKPHLFKPEELKERYADWGILHYWQGLGVPFVSKRTGTILKRHRADLIAQKI